MAGLALIGICLILLGVVLAIADSNTNREIEHKRMVVITYCLIFVGFIVALSSCFLGG